MQLVPNNRFISFFGPDGVGKSTLTGYIVEQAGQDVALIRASKPDTWPGRPVTTDFSALEEEVRREKDPLRHTLARLAFSRMIIVANYLKAAELSAETVVLNDSDVLLKALVWAAHQGERLEARFDDFASCIQQDAAGIFPANIFYVRAPGSHNEQVSTISRRLSGRETASLTDPTSLGAVSQRIEANEQVYTFLETRGRTDGFAVHQLINPEYQPDQFESSLRSLAARVLSAAGIQPSRSEYPPTKPSECIYDI